jgi:hypothetical protein
MMMQKIEKTVQHVAQLLPGSRSIPSLAERDTDGVLNGARRACAFF